MEDKENGIDFYNFLEQENRFENNSFANNLNNIYELNPQISIIERISTSSISSKTSLFIYKNILKDNFIPYPDNDEIPLIKIKDENYFENGNNIKNYLLGKFDDNKFNICRQCKEKKNKFFCHNCKRNICDICQNICLAKNHYLIKLKDYFKELKINIMSINLIISKNFILPKKNQFLMELKKRIKFLK